MDISVDEFHAALDAERAARRQGGAADKTAAGGNGNGDGDEIDAEKHLFGEDGFTFSDFLDIINPLQHIPIVSTIYRELSGDKIAMLPRVIGGTLFGGPIGAGAAVANAVLEQGTGRDIGEHVVALFTGDEAPATAIAAATPPEAAMTTAAGRSKHLADIRITQFPLPANAFAAPSQAELDILQAEAAIAVRTPTEPPRRQAAEHHQQVALNTVTSGDMPIDAPFAAPTTAEEKILATEAVFSRLAAKDQPPQQAFAAAESAATKSPARSVPLIPAQRAIPTATSVPPPQAPAAESPWLSFAPPTANPATQPQAMQAIQATQGARPNRLAGYARTMPPQKTIDTPPQDAFATPPQGAVAAKGGWFSDVMLTALNKYEQGRQLKQPAPPRAVNQLN